MEQSGREEEICKETGWFKKTRRDIYVKVRYSRDAKEAEGMIQREKHQKVKKNHVEAHLKERINIGIMLTYLLIICRFSQGAAGLRSVSGLGTSELRVCFWQMLFCCIQHAGMRVSTSKCELVVLCWKTVDCPLWVESVTSCPIIFPTTVNCTQATLR